MKSSIIKTSVFVFCLTVFTSIYSFSQQHNRQEKKPLTFAELLKEMDAKKDGKLSKNEIKGPLKDYFSKIDTDEDGFISEKEFKKAPKPKKGERPSNNNQE